MSTLLFVQQKIVGRQSVGGDGRMLRRLGRVVTARSSNNNNIRMTTRATSATSSSSSSSSWRGQQQQRPLPLQTYHYRWYHASSTVHASASAAAGEPTPEELAAEQDPTSIPEWQNPKHAATAATTAEPQFFDDDNNEDATPSIMNNNAAPLPPFETSPDAVVAPPHIEALAHQIVQLNLLELKELTDQIAQAFDFDDDMMAASYGAGAAMAAPGAAAAADAEPEEVKTIFDIKLIGFDAKAKIKVIKEIRSIAGLGLKEAKELVEAAPKVFAKDLKSDKAEEIKAQLEAVGAQVEIV